MRSTGYLWEALEKIKTGHKCTGPRVCVGVINIAYVGVLDISSFHWVLSFLSDTIIQNW